MAGDTLRESSKPPGGKCRMCRITSGLHSSASPPVLRRPAGLYRQPQKAPALEALQEAQRTQDEITAQEVAKVLGVTVRHARRYRALDGD